jgi:hypothetical protein
MKLSALSGQLSAKPFTADAVNLIEMKRRWLITPASILSPSGWGAGEVLSKQES